ncbi:hypothetical protein [Thioalbus denitrificans]|uniref:Uncharacterized protein n=1 Tax=Thioalbus denitrificans TaxID=547122 RepID=A0A369CDN2_9GAMM|nr:hypothetical protein [Thioalbus denitrificans]RCX32019.1 hypothetical protein DFQ59_102369 [Thioalbus denitrificans]
MIDSRIILFHTQATSARTRFLRLPGATVCGFEPLPPGAELLAEGSGGKVALHPGAAVRDAELRLGLPVGSLEAEGEYLANVQAGSGPVTVFLARFTTIDPPFAAAAAAGAEFIDLTAARGLPALELELLRRAYELILGG